ncbi:hypothetical protein PIB30_003842 [Stylosanthes scabra]|uniref:Uncharacterized protein n=1 Tax=Stylosanthes scabra TaxID=79078 RepID=A0ABU6T373_9FABA|nr:hypothetical protein [Stylosanthes scabra]
MNNNAGYSKITASTKSRSIDYFSSDSFPHGGGGERFGVILGRSGSVSSASSSSSSYGGGFLKKAFSMRRSSSVSERYCRIHDQYMAITSPDNEIIITRSVKTKNIKHSSNNNGRGGGSKIFKACRVLSSLSLMCM